EGRMFVPGTVEVIVGAGAAEQFEGLVVGNSVRWGTTDWRIVGRFEDKGSVSESEVWTDATVLQGAYNRGNSYQSVRAKLTSADALTAFRDSLSNDPRVNTKVYSESAFYAEQSEALRVMITGLGFGIAILMGLGAVFAALNTMYSAVSARTREIATLRALGFGSFPVVISVIVEALLLALVGSIVGMLISYFAFNGIRASTLNFGSFTQLSFAFTVTPDLLLQGLIYAILLGLIGGLLPSLRAARLPIATGLRELWTARARARRAAPAEDLPLASKPTGQLAFQTSLSRCPSCPTSRSISRPSSLESSAAESSASRSRIPSCCVLPLRRSRAV